LRRPGDGTKAPSAKPTIEGSLRAVKNVGGAKYDLSIARRSGQSTFPELGVGRSTFAVESGA
jgi:hypothetical protein